MPNSSEELQDVYAYLYEDGRIGDMCKWLKEIAIQLASIRETIERSAG